MARTRRELIDQVLDNLGVLVPGQSPGDEAVSRVDGVLDPCLATLAALGIIYVADAGTPNPPSDGEIDDAVFLPLAAYVAWATAGGFNLVDSPSLKILSDQAEKVLRLIGRPASTRQILRTDRQLLGTRIRARTGSFSQGT
jgi:hypothetical protein